MIVYDQHLNVKISAFSTEVIVRIKGKISKYGLDGHD
jgi:hypothetical protein